MESLKESIRNGLLSLVSRSGTYHTCFKFGISHSIEARANYNVCRKVVTCAGHSLRLLCQLKEEQVAIQLYVVEATARRWMRLGRGFSAAKALLWTRAQRGKGCAVDEGSARQRLCCGRGLSAAKAVLWTRAQRGKGCAVDEGSARQRLCCGRGFSTTNAVLWTRAQHGKGCAVDEGSARQRLCRGRGFSAAKAVLWTRVQRGRGCIVAEGVPCRRVHCCRSCALIDKILCQVKGIGTARTHAGNDHKCSIGGEWIVSALLNSILRVIGEV
ncbi:uncharacterized protein LOC119585167 isoform X1 [Penaeus monodon]|uniref:uncharacterized protein LOC119585167 isoform X1 n=1 Tax=Penaeus monodon TaxID=6687 RepID=UPI0018A71894|nr:uncharacterized protein LOC119585167 isoform X1 [Penaeus monodon]XP_037789731.1 uncharacterized protein LOC119585167 isoform X1 [Penaeus monodon]